MRHSRKASDNILCFGSAGIKLVHEEGLKGRNLLVAPFIGLEKGVELV